MSSRHSKSLNAKARTRVCTCPHLFVRERARVIRVCLQPLHARNLCVCALVRETEGKDPCWDNASAEKMRGCMWPACKEPPTALERKILLLNHHIHPPPDIHRMSLWMAPFESCSISAECQMGLHRKLLPLHCVTTMYIMHVYGS